MRIVVVGPGAVGSLVGGLLAAAGHDVAFLGRPAAEAAASPGVVPASLIIRRPAGGTDVTVTVTRLAAAADLAAAPDLVILAVRQVDLAGALDAIAPWPDAATLTIQNGIGAEDLAGLRRPAAPLVAASLTAPVDLAGPAEVRWLGRGGIGLAAARGDVGPLPERLRADFASVGLRAAVCRDAVAMKWSKVLANLVGNATGAILDMDVGAIYADPALFEIERRQLREALWVMRRLGRRPIALPGARVPLLALGVLAPAALSRPIMRRVVGGVRGGKLPSLRAHVREGRGPSEVAWLNGAVARTAATLGGAAPVNALLARLVTEVTLEPDRRAWYRERPDRLIEAVRTG